MRISLAVGALAVVAALGALALSLVRPPAAPPNTFVAMGREEVFSRELVAGCALGERELYLAGRGALARYDGERWWLATLSPAIDARALACRDATVVAVGAGGWLVHVDVPAAQLELERVADVGLRAVALLEDGSVYAVGDEETIVVGRPGAWHRLRGSPGGRPWLSMHPRSRDEVWLGTRDATVVVHDGRSFEERLIPEMCPWNDKERCGHDVTAIAPYGERVAVAAGRVYAFLPPGRVSSSIQRSFGWTRTSDGGTGPLELIWKPGPDVRSLFSPDGERIYIVSAIGLTVVRGVAPHHSAESKLPHGLGCPLRAVFGGGGRAVWLLGAGERSGLAHFDGSSWRTIQRC